MSPASQSHTDTTMPLPHSEQEVLRLVKSILASQKRVEGLVHKQEMPRRELVENLVHSQHLAKLEQVLARLDNTMVAAVLAALDAEERLTVWGRLKEDRGDDILEKLDDDIREALVGAQPQQSHRIMLNAFELHNGRLRQIPVDNREDLANVRPIWVDLVAPTEKVRAWVGAHFGLELPDPDELTDLEASARFYVEDNGEKGEVHLHSDFLLDLEEESRNVAVAFILHNDILFSVRKEELPVFRLQRLRARTQPGYVNDGKDVLLDLYAADAEYSADALEDVYADLEKAGKHVLQTQVSDEDAANILAEIARAEDLNGRIRRNVMDTRRAVSFLTRGKFLNSSQQEDARQILRDIESLDGHTTFLFGKINFLMDATVGFININQNQRVNKLTTISVVFMPINIVAGIGGMSEFSMMTAGVPWPVAYGAFVLGMGLLGLGTYQALRLYESRKAKREMEARLRRDAS
ncbi:MAG TPA: magnesium and cobalt transport protein CorA [Rhodocyclaceae bacterium]|nr:magnesium and cobalt transport protein CorA [Rhodocyclaceae bacterium]